MNRDQAAMEQYLQDRLDMHDVNVLLDYATFAEQELESEPIRNLLLAILPICNPQWSFMLAEVGTHSRGLSAALKDLGERLEQQREAFLAQGAKAILDEAKGIKA